MGQYNKIADIEIEALVDNELSEEKKKEVLTFIGNDNLAYKRYKEITIQNELLKIWWEGNVRKNKRTGN